MLNSQADGTESNPEAEMGTIRCKTCRGTWTVTTVRTETVIAQNHAYLNPGHRTATIWDQPTTAGGFQS